MNIKEARELLGNRAPWELLAMKRALESMPALNNDEENKRLEAVKVVMKANGKNLKASMNRGARLG